MTKPAISVEHLSKAYRIGLQEVIPDTLVGAATSWLSAPLRNFRRLCRLDTGRSAAASAPANGNGNGNGNGPAAAAFEEQADTLWALRDVSFEVAEGEVVGIIGRNGAGKSTLLKVLSRITEPTSGRVVIHGRVSSLLEVGTGFHPELSGRENIYMNGTILGMKKREIDRKFDEIVDFSGVEKFLDTPVKRYSSGMTVRLAFSVAAHLEPEILVIDEVLAVGDVGFQQKCIGKMRDVAHCGRTVLFVSHNMPAVESLCTRAVHLEDGSVAMNGDVCNVINAYRERAYGAATLGMSEQLKKAVYFRGLHLLNGNSQPTHFAPLGADLTLQVLIRVPRIIRSPKIGIAFDDALGHRMLTVHTPMDNTIEHLDGTCDIRCSIPNFPLAPGKYSVKVALTESQHELEAIESATVFHVIDSAVGDGRGFHRGVCVARSQWQIYS